MYDVIIIGKGPAGLSAALYTVRANLKTLIIATGYGAAGTAEKIDNYFGFSHTVSGTQLIKNSEQMLKALGGEFSDEEVTDISMNYDDMTFIVKTPSSIHTAKKIILATGKNRTLPSIPGLKRYDGKGISRCAVCDAFFYKGKNVAVLGNGKFAFAEAEELSGIVKNITIYTNGEKAGTDKFNLDTRKIAEAYGDDKIRGFIMADGQKTEFDGLFIADGIPGGTEFGAKLGVMMKDGSVITDQNGKTNVPGFFAAGDCAGAPYQISVSVGRGALAALAVIAELRKS